MSKKEKRKKKICGFHKAEKNTFTGVYSSETFFPLHLDYKTILFLAGQGFAVVPHQSHNPVL